MRKMTIGVRGRGVSISHVVVDNPRLVTVAQARRYAAQLVAAADIAERTAPPVETVCAGCGGKSIHDLLCPACAEKAHAADARGEPFPLPFDTPEKS